jgi:molybdopterin-guanine dinucleotide biosynthesis protein A
MGGVDKGLIEIAGRPMIERVLSVLEPQVDRVLINANRNTGRYAEYGHEVITDSMGGYLGPLAGVLSGLQTISNGYLLCVPCDSPLMATDLAERLLRACLAGPAEIAVAHDGERLQPVFMLLRAGLRESLAAYLSGGGRKIDRWLADHRVATVDFSDRRDSFVNVNDPEERERVAALLRSQPG